MNFRLVSAALLCAAIGTVSYAAADEGATTAPVATAAPAADPKNEVICKIEPPPLGTRIGRRRMCATRQEWDDVATKNQRDLQRAQLGPMINRQNPDGN